MIFIRLSLKSLVFIWKPIILLRWSLKSSMFLWKTTYFLQILVQISDFPFEKLMILSAMWVIQICVSDRLKIPPNETLGTFGSERAFASKGYLLKMSPSERPPFSRKWGFQIWDFQTPKILVEISDVSFEIFEGSVLNSSNSLDWQCLFVK